MVSIRCTFATALFVDLLSLAVVDVVLSCLLDFIQCFIIQRCTEGGVKRGCIQITGKIKGGGFTPLVIHPRGVSSLLPHST